MSVLRRQKGSQVDPCAVPAVAEGLHVSDDVDRCVGGEGAFEVALELRLVGAGVDFDQGTFESEGGGEEWGGGGRGGGAGSMGTMRVVQKKL
jgi:hypothetical protein